MRNSKPERLMANTIDANCRLSLAIDALDAVRDLCCEAGNSQHGCGMSQVDADHFASLLGLIVHEMREANEGGTVIRSDVR